MLGNSQMDLEKGMGLSLGLFMHQMVGGVYQGEYKNNRRNGKGKRTYRDGSILEGYWKDNKFWNGTKYDKEGNISGKYVNGEWKKI